MIKKLRKINEDLIKGFANDVPTMLASIGYIALYPLVFIFTLFTIGDFYRGKYPSGILYLFFTCLSFYIGRGILRYLEKLDKKD